MLVSAIRTIGLVYTCLKITDSLGPKIPQLNSGNTALDFAYDVAVGCAIGAGCVLLAPVTAPLGIGMLLVDSGKAVHQHYITRRTA